MIKALAESFEELYRLFYETEQVEEKAHLARAIAEVSSAMARVSTRLLEALNAPPEAEAAADEDGEDDGGFL